MLLDCIFFSSRRRHTRWPRDWSSDVCSSDLPGCSRVLTDAARAIGRVVAGLCQSLNPQVVCIGGELAEAEEAFLTPLTDTVQEHMLPNQVAPTRSEERRVGKEWRSG